MTKRLVVGLVGMVMFFAFFVQGGAWTADFGTRLPEGAIRIAPSTVTDSNGRMVSGKAPVSPTIPLPKQPERGLYLVLETGGVRLGLYGFESFVPYAEKLLLNGQKLDLAQVTITPGNALPRGVTRDQKGFRKYWSQDTVYVLQTGAYTAEIRVFVDAKNFWSFTFDVNVQDFQFYVGACLKNSDIELQYSIWSIGKIPTKVDIKVPDVGLSALISVKKTGTSSGIATWLTSGVDYKLLSGQEWDTTVADASNPRRTAALPVYYPDAEYLGSCAVSPPGGGGKG